MNRSEVILNVCHLNNEKINQQLNLNEWKCLIFQYNTHTNNPNYSVNSVFCTCNAMLTLTSHDEQVHVYNQCQTQIYVELIAKQLLATQNKIDKRKFASTKCMYFIKDKQNQQNDRPTYLEKLFRSLLDVCRSSSAGVISIERFLPRGIIYMNKNTSIQFFKNLQLQSTFSPLH